MLAVLPTFAWASSPGRLAAAAAVTVAFAILALALRGVNRTGAIAGGLACLLLCVSAGPAGFAALSALFALTWTSTRFGYRRKQELGLAESREGRTGWQILANLGVAAASALIFSFTGNHAWLVAASAALAEAATDTVASEIGQSGSRTARLITNGKPVPAGTDGGITLLGTLAGAAAGILVSAVAAGSGMISNSQMWIAAGSGLAGMFVDSCLGAVCQRRGWISNETVNLFGTLTAAALALFIAAARI